VTFWRCAAK